MNSTEKQNPDSELNHYVYLIYTSMNIQLRAGEIVVAGQIILRRRGRGRHQTTHMARSPLPAHVAVGHLVEIVRQVEGSRIGLERECKLNYYILHGGKKHPIGTRSSH